MPISKKKAGAPSKYKPEYCEKIIEYFEFEILNKNFPSFEGFAAEISINLATCYEWKKRHDAFNESWEKALNMQKSYLFNKALKNEYNASFAKFLCSCNYGMVEKTAIDNTSSDGSMTPTINFIEK